MHIIDTGLRNVPHESEASLALNGALSCPNVFRTASGLSALSLLSAAGFDPLQAAGLTPLPAGQMLLQETVKRLVYKAAAGTDMPV